MKTFRLFLWVIAALLAFSACSDDDDEVLPEVYKVSVTTDNNGTAVADPAEAAAGEKITLKATANEGYAFAGWTVESGSVMLASVTAAETSFTMPKGDVSIKAAFVAGGTEPSLPEVEDVLALIKDETFKAYSTQRMKSAELDADGNVYVKWDTDGNGKLSSKEAAEVTWINMANDPENHDGSDVSSLEGIEYFTNLEYLNCYCNNIESVDLSHNTKLTYLNLSQNNLSGLDVTHNTALVELLAEENEDLQEIDVTTLSEVKTLSFYDTGLTEIDVTKCPKLEKLVLRMTSIATVDLSKNPELLEFDADGYQGLFGESTGKLTSVDFSHNLKLTSISVSRNKLTAIDVSMCPDLKVLIVGKNQLTELNVTQNPKLTNLQIGSNQISRIDLSYNPDLYYLYADKNELTEVDITKCPKLVYCHVFANRLTEFDATHMDFKIDEKTGELTIGYDLWCGCQRQDGVSVEDYAAVEFGVTGHPEMFKTMKLKLRNDQKDGWVYLEPGRNARNNFCTLEYVD